MHSSAWHHSPWDRPRPGLVPWTVTARQRRPCQHPVGQYCGKYMADLNGLNVEHFFLCNVMLLFNSDCYSTVKNECIMQVSFQNYGYFWWLGDLGKGNFSRDFTSGEPPRDGCVIHLKYFCVYTCHVNKCLFHTGWRRDPVLRHDPGSGRYIRSGLWFRLHYALWQHCE